MDMVTVVTPGLVIVDVFLRDSLFETEPIPGITNQTYASPNKTPSTTVSIAGGRFSAEDCDVN